MPKWTWLGAAVLLGCAGSASAKDTDPCPKDMVCASDPNSVGGAMMRAGYQGLIETDGEGDPMISSAAAGYKFSVYFYDCEKHKQCASLQFAMRLTPSKPRDLAFVNKWNNDKRFTQLALTKDGDLRLSYDVTTIGGLTRANFADVVDWWATMMGTLDTFIAANPPVEPVRTVPSPSPFPPPAQAPTAPMAKSTT
ncbi:YbjN domain-containing protein [Sphingomonadaceae bacterium jetA1]|jgi:hypothetical protein|uniref:YbjN domain-containing protein n=1 Tax=Facivitalis istanbulensis TaxID=3075838 RepID=UPI0034796523